MACIAVAGGGTGGHVFPALAVVEALRARGTQRVVWIGSRSRSDRSLVEAEGIEYHAIPTGKLRRYLSLRNAIDVFKILAGVASSLRILARTRPQVLFSKGGFVSVPPAVAAWLLRIPVVSHECDVTPGLATRINALFSAAMLVSHQETVRLMGRAADRTRVTGNPVRKAIAAGDRMRGRAQIGVQEGLPVVLVTGGSLGAAALNRAVWGAREELCRRAFVVHQRGRHPGPDRAPRYLSAPFYFAEYPDLLAAADLVVCRAGANNLSELAALGKPAILVPLPLGSSRGDQITNAARYAKSGAAVVLAQARLDGPSLRALAEELLGDPARLEAMGAAARLAAAPDAARQIAETLGAVARGPRSRRGLLP
jgi:UDP-N-acetylglucosamine--N-acetylmuramyl-(pentapeptide) pyrophosphoryl-undecaprenol N-acetylglucosamine transferase